MEGIGDPFVVARFWSKVHVARPSECWEWQKAKREDGYGMFATGNGGRRKVRAHRFAWAWFHGRDPGSGVVRHECDNPSCCNPAHLLIGTQRENVADTFARGRQHTTAKLDAAQHSEIVKRWGRGERQVDLAAEFGVSQATISAIVRRVYGPAKNKTHAR